MTNDAPLSAPQRTMVLSYAAAFLLVPALVVGSWQILQMMVFGGRILVPGFLLKLGLAGVLLLTFSPDRAKALGLRSGLGRALVLLVGALLVWLTISLFLGSSSPLSTTLAGYANYYAWPAILLLTLFTTLRFRSERVVRVILLVTLPVAVLCLVQTLMQDPLVPLHSRDGWFTVHSVDFQARVRAFGIFASPELCATLLSASAAILFAASRDGSFRSRGLRFAGGLAAAAAVAGTLNRQGYLILLVSLGALPLLSVLARRKAWTLVRLLPFLVSGIILIALLALLPLSSRLSGIFLTESLMQRLDNGMYHLLVLGAGGLPSLLIGTGVVQHPGLFPEFVLMDSTFLALVRNIGLIGAALALALATLWWELGVARWRAHPSDPVLRGLMAWGLTWPVQWALGVSFTETALLWGLGMLVLPRERVHEMEGSTAPSAPASFRPWPVLAAALLFAALHGSGYRLVRNPSEAARLWETREKLLALRDLQHRHRAETGRWCDGVDSLRRFAEARALPIRQPRERWLAHPLDVTDLRTNPFSGRPYVVLADSSGQRYQIRDPDDRGYVGSWTRSEEFDRASWW